MEIQLKKKAQKARADVKRKASPADGLTASKEEETTCPKKKAYFSAADKSPLCSEEKKSSCFS